MHIGESKIDKHGVRWVVTGVWRWPTHIDYAMRNTETGETGGCREILNN